jgi:hypothetical protein
LLVPKGTHLKTTLERKQRRLWNLPVRWNCYNSIVEFSAQLCSNVPSSEQPTPLFLGQTPRSPISKRRENHKLPNGTESLKSKVRGESTYHFNTDPSQTNSAELLQRTSNFENSYRLHLSLEMHAAGTKMTGISSAFLTYKYHSKQSYGLKIVTQLMEVCHKHPQVYNRSAHHMQSQEKKRWTFSHYE